MVLTRAAKRTRDTLEEENNTNKKSKLEERVFVSDDEDDDIISIGSSDSDSDSDSDEELNELKNCIADYEDTGEIVIGYEDLCKILHETDPIAADNLQKVVQTIDNKTPKFMTLLQENVEHKDRVKLIELYEALKEIEVACLGGHPSKLEYLTLRDHINSLIKKFRAKKQASDKLSAHVREALKKTKEDLESAIPKTESLEAKILSLDTSPKNRVAIYNRYQELERANSDDGEKSKIITWLNWATKIPHDKMKNMSEQRNNIPATLRTLAHELEKELYGMREVKEQILTFVNARLQNPLTRGCSLALLGPPGTGKTTIARLLSKVLTTPFAQMSFGGVRDASFLKGHDFCYVGSRPGEIVRCLASMEYKNGVLFMDEFEKVSNNKEIVSCLLHIVDPSQNSEFRDSYLREITIDLSNLWFIYSMNSPPEDSALNDRLYKIDVPGYTKKEKLEIVRRYSLKKSLKNAGLKETDIQLSEDVAKYLIDRVSPEKSGIRAIEQALTNVVNKVSFLVNNAKNLKDFPYRISFTVSEKLSYPVNLTRNMIEKFVSVDKEKIEILSHLYM